MLQNRYFLARLGKFCPYSFQATCDILVTTAVLGNLGHPKLKIFVREQVLCHLKSFIKLSRGFIQPRVYMGKICPVCLGNVIPDLAWNRVKLYNPMYQDVQSNMQKSERHGGQNGQYANNAIENSADASEYKRQFPQRNRS